MKVKDYILQYANDVHTPLLAKHLEEVGKNIRIKGLSGSLDAVIAVALSQQTNKNHFFILHDKEEAAYFINDLQNLGEQKEVLLFPTSYKRPYQFEETENANILMRAEVLNRLNQTATKGIIVVTYPDALSEKVINKQSLVANTFGAKVGEKVDTTFLSELLYEYDFEKADFVFEPGQYAIRGGIIDIFSYANELPYRIELFGKEIESIRTFNPDSQLSIEHKQFISIIPNVQTKLLKETRESILHFLPENSVVWFKNATHTFEVIDKFYKSAEQDFEKIIATIGVSSLITKSNDLFETSKQFIAQLGKYNCIEFGTKFSLKEGASVVFESKVQESFHKNTQLIADTLAEFQSKNYTLYIASEAISQFEKIQTILEEINAHLKLNHLHTALREGYVDHLLKIVCFTDHQLFDRFHRSKTKDKYSKSKSITLKELKTIQPGDFVTHADYGVARFAGLDTVEVNGKKQEAIRLIFRDDDLLYASIHALHKISKYSGKEGGPPMMSKLGSPEWENKKKNVKKKVKDIAKELILLYAKRKAAPGYAYTRDSFLQAELETSFIYEDTPDQAKATEDVKADMEKPHPMDRLVCGDVGFGKTEIAIRAAFKAICDGKQVAVLVPTTVLAMQHYKTFSERLEKFPCRVEYVNRFKTAGQIKDTLKRVAEGKTDILIGTHRVVSKDVKFKDIGLLIIDEEQKFGVTVKEKLKNFKVNVDTLTLTATPIPRTLHFSLMGARDLSIIATPPPNRQPVTTEIQVYNDILVRDAIATELKRGGQVFFVHNRVNDLEAIANKIFKLVPEARIGCAHGQMDGDKLEKIMLGFIEGDYDVLVSTNIIESGLDIPNANTIIINQAHMFGLSDLHQMRGRVGRSNKKAFCYLLTPAVSALTGDARKRLGTLEEFSDLGDGFKVAMRDLDIRGAGNLLGSEQTGFISDLGFEMYHEILDEAVRELKDTEFKDLFKTEIDLRKLLPDCVIETDLSIIIPEKYVANISERLSLYSELDNIKDEAAIQHFITSVQDRFGPMPTEVLDLIETVKLRWHAEQLGFEKLSLKNGIMKAQLSTLNKEDYFNSDIFGAILKYVQAHSKHCKLKDAKEKLIISFEPVSTIERGLEILFSIYSNK